MKVVELAAREATWPFDTWRSLAGKLWSDRQEDHRAGVEIRHLAGVGDLPVLVDVHRENPIRPRAASYATASECCRDNPWIARITLQLDCVALEVARNPETLHFIVRSLQEIRKNVVELDHPDVRAYVFS